MIEKKLQPIGVRKTIQNNDKRDESPKTTRIKTTKENTKYLKAGKHWTDSEDNLLRKGYCEDSLSPKDLSIVHKRSESAIRSRLSRLGVLKKNKVVKKQKV